MNTAKYSSLCNTVSPERIPGWRVMASALGYHGDRKNVIGKEYFVRQAAILFGMAKTTTDPKISAAFFGQSGRS
jgi:hypothetical protein